MHGRWRGSGGGGGGGRTTFSLRYAPGVKYLYLVETRSVYFKTNPFFAFVALTFLWFGFALLCFVLAFCFSFSFVLFWFGLFFCFLGVRFLPFLIVYFFFVSAFGSWGGMKWFDLCLLVLCLNFCKFLSLFCNLFWLLDTVVIDVVLFDSLSIKI